MPDKNYKVTFHFATPVCWGNALFSIFLRCQNIGAAHSHLGIVPRSDVRFDRIGLTIRALLDEPPSNIHQRIDGVIAIACNGTEFFRVAPALVTTAKKAAA